MKNNKFLKLRISLLLIFPIFLILSQASCKKDWFDIKADKNLTVPTSIQDFEYLLDNYYVMNQESVGIGEVSSDGHFMPESRLLGISDGAEKNAYSWSNNFPYLKVPDWINSYQKIFYCNLVLDGLKKITPASGEEKQRWNSVKGNALFHRAKNLYDLAQLYAQPYNPLSANVDLGIPLKEGINVTEKAIRSTVAQTYSQITNDLKTAVNLLPINQRANRGSKVNTYALLARTYLIMGNYLQAGLYADSSLSHYNVLMDYNTIPLNAANLGEFNDEVLFASASSGLYLSTFVSGYVYIDKSLFDLYDDNDLRKQIFFMQSVNGIEFKGSYASSRIPFTGLATDEIYLIRAECNARNGNSTAAMKDLNDLLRTRWKKVGGITTYVDQVASSAEEALDKILKERKKELLMRCIRWTDLRRLNLQDKYKTTLTRTIGGNIYTLEPNSYKYTFPIPDDVIALSGMEQSPGW